MERQRSVGFEQDAGLRNVDQTACTGAQRTIRADSIFDFARGCIAAGAPSVNDCPGKDWRVKRSCIHSNKSVKALENEPAGTVPDE